MRIEFQDQARSWIDFTAEDHLRVQQQIERRPYGLWVAEGCPEGSSLRNWLRAEREVLTQFCAAYDRHIPTRCTSRPGRNINVTRPKPRTANLNPRANVQARNPDPRTTTPVRCL
jgi:hypothetical protein